MKIVIDTNIWISFLIGKSFSDFYKVLGKKEIAILSSRQQIEELIRVMNRPKFNKYFSFDEKEFLLHLIERKTELVEIQRMVDSCRDKKDNYLLNIAINGAADYLLTGDSDLLCLNPFEGIAIIKYQDYIERIL